MIRPRKAVDTFRQADSFVFSPTHPNSSMVVLPLISNKARSYDPARFKKLSTLFKTPSHGAINFIKFDSQFVPTLREKFDAYMEYIDDDEPSFPTTD